MYNSSNFYGMNPMYYGNIPQKVGLFSKIRNGVNWSNLLNNTSKTLNVINQAIPIFYQVKPLFQNAKTMFKIADIIRSDDISREKAKEQKERRNTDDLEKNSTEKKEESQYSSNQPTFFL